MENDKLPALLNSVFKYLDKALTARESFYRGMDEAAAKALIEKHPNFGPTDAKYRFGKSLKGAQLIADNKWHMAQSRTFALAAVARGIFVLVTEQRRTNALLEENNRLLKETNGAIRRSGNSG